MKHDRTITITTVLALAVALAAGSALAQRGTGPGRGQGRDPHAAGEPMPRGPEARWERMAEALDLSEAQIQAIAEIREAARGEGRALQKKILQLRHELEGQMLADEPDEGALIRLTDQIGEARTDLQKHRLRTRLAIRGQLTTEQRDQWLLMRDRHEGRGPGRGQGRGHRCGAGGPGCEGPRMQRRHG